MLAAAGLVFEIVPPGVPEDSPEGLAPAEAAALVAARKCDAVASERPEALVLAADTVVVLDGASLGKPAHREEALSMLRSLSGRTHSVLTAVCLEHRASGLKRDFTVSSLVTFGAYGDRNIEEYLSCVEVMDKAGAYGIQERPDLLLASVEGSVDNVIGLPLREVLEALKEIGAR